MSVSRKLLVSIVAGLILVSMTSFLHAQSPTGRIVVKVTGIRNANGKMKIGLWRSKDGFPKDSSKAVRSVTVEIADGAATAAFADVPHGEYAVAVYHDENNNGKMDTRFPGIPAEGIGSSNNPHSRFGPPSFDQCRFEARSPETLVEIKMLYL